MPDCEYCGKTLKTKSSLNHHKKTARACLKIQGKKYSTEFECTYCHKILATSFNLKRHSSTCVSVREEIMLLKHELNFIKKENKELKNRPTISNSNNIQNLLVNLAPFDKTTSDIKKIVDEKYNKDYFLQGQKGVAKFTDEHVLTSEDGRPVYVVTDKNRGHAKYRNKKNEIIRDLAMFGITNKIYPGLKKKIVDIAAKENAFTNDVIMRLYQEISKMLDDNSIFRKELVRLLLKKVLESCDDSTEEKKENKIVQQIIENVEKNILYEDSDFIIEDETDSEDEDEITVEVAVGVTKLETKTNQLVS